MGRRRVYLRTRLEPKQDLSNATDRELEQLVNQEIDATNRLLQEVESQLGKSADSSLALGYYRNLSKHLTQQERSNTPSEGNYFGSITQGSTRNSVLYYYNRLKEVQESIVPQSNAIGNISDDSIRARRKELRGIYTKEATEERRRLREQARQQSEAKAVRAERTKNIYETSQKDKLFYDEYKQNSNLSAHDFAEIIFQDYQNAGIEDSETLRQIYDEAYNYFEEQKKAGEDSYQLTFDSRKESEKELPITEGYIDPREEISQLFGGAL